MESEENRRRKSSLSAGGHASRVEKPGSADADRVVTDASVPVEGKPSFPIVGVGASAGGLEAFTRFLRALPADTGMAFVLVQHLAPSHESALAGILSRATSMPVTEVADEPEVKPNHVYVIPPNRNMIIARGRLKRQEGTRAEVCVSDTGQGISAEALPRIFDRFRQSEPFATGIKGGLGLGLAVSKQLVELHGGDVSARSPGKGKGATFTVSIPLASEARPAVGPKDGAEISPVSLNGFMVLVVDDEPEAREPIRRVLEEYGAEVLAVRSADEALDAIQQQRPDVLVSDISMPKRDGYYLIRAIRALPPGQGGRVPAIALAAFGTTEDRERALRRGYTSHLTKPVGPSELIAAVAALLPPREGQGTGVEDGTRR